MKSRKAQYSIAIVCVVLGLMLAYQFQNANNISSIYARKQVDEMQGQLIEVQKQKEDLEKSVSSLENKIEEFEKSATITSGYASSLKNELDNVRMLAGLTKVEGAGVIVTVSPQISDIDNKSTIEVYAEYLLLLVNELNASGAEAIMINGERVVSTTQIRDVVLGRTIQINGVRQRSYEPFEIKAIGDPATLDGGLKTSAEQVLLGYGIRLDIQKSSKVTINKYNKVIEPIYAKPVKEGE